MEHERHYLGSVFSGVIDAPFPCFFQPCAEQRLQAGGIRADLFRYEKEKAQMIKITDRFIHEMADKAKGAPRKRAHHFFPGDPGDGVQPFLLSMDPEAYVRPHRHSAPGGIELFAVLKGQVLVVTFDDTGASKDHAVLQSRGGCRIVKIEAGDWHTAMALLPGSVVLDIKEGPHDPETDKTFAPWAPLENSPEARAFNERILRDLKRGRD